MKKFPPRMHGSRPRRSQRRLSFEPLEHRLLLDAGVAELADDAFSIHQNRGPQLLDVLANDAFPPDYSGGQRITSVSYGSEGGRVEIADQGGAIRYAPPADFFGPETFVYYVDNWLSATVTVTVASPLAFDEYEVLPDGEARVLDVLANDPFWAEYDGPGQITSVSETSLGNEVAIAADGKSLVYTAASDAYGKDAFVYIVDDLYPAQVKIEIPNPLEDDRYADIVQQSENNVLDVLANDPFWPGYPGAGQITLVTEPTSGGTVTISDTGRTVIYTPPADFAGSDRFTYVVDGVYEATVHLKVHRPVQDDRYEVDVNSTDHPMMVTHNDSFVFWDGSRSVERDVIDQVTWVGETEHGGTVEIMADGQGVRYSAPAGFEGTDTFEYVADGKHRATVTVDVTRPVRDDFFNSTGTRVYEDTVDNVLDVLRNDFKGNGYQGERIITSVSEISEGAVVTIAADRRSLVYTPPEGFRGTDEFRYTVDGEFQANVRVNVGPIAASDRFRFAPDPSRAEYVLDVLGNDHFGSNYPGPGQITAVSETANGGTVTISDGGRRLRFVPAEGGSDKFTYTVDGKYEASVTVSFVDYLARDSFAVDQNSLENELDPLANDFASSASDDYLGPRRITSAGPSEHGAAVTIAADGETVVYSPAPDFYGEDRFTYTVDGLMQETMTVNVIRRVRDDVYRVEADSQDNALPVLAGDLFGADYSGAGRITGVTETSAGGTAAVSEDGASILYTPPAGYTGEETFAYTVDGVLKAEVTVWVGTSVEDVLPRFDSPADFKQFLLDDALARYDHLFGSSGQFDTSGDVTDSPTLSSPDHSETNVQVAGVDEADIVETDGDYLYVLTGGELIIAKAWPADETSIVSRVAIEGDQVIGEYLHGDRLAVISRKWEDWSVPADVPPGVEIDAIGGWWPWPRTSVTWVTVYDVSDRASPTIVEKTRLDGAYVESRRIDDFVFLVLRDDGVERWLPEPMRTAASSEGEGTISESGDNLIPLSPTGYLIPAPGTTYVYETREQYIERMTAEMDRFLPHYASYGPDGELLGTGLLLSADLFQPLSADDGSLVTVVSLNMSSDEPGITESTGIFTSGASKIYGSLDSLYVFDQEYTWEDGAVTRILKFDWDAAGGDVELAAQGQVAGTMLNQFSADEHEGYLRIATTISNTGSGNWSGRSENVLFVLRDDGGVLELVGGMQNLALGERIRSVRFLGERAFVTTFRDVDPLFALDLSDPAHPQSCGHVTMPGYNSYMQLIDANHILAVGRNTPIGGSGPTQVALFDVTDLAQPRLVDQYTFERFSTSEAEVDHHAFGWFAEYQVLAMPSARVYWERVDEDGDGYRETRRSVREDEMLVFQIDVTAAPGSDLGIQFRGSIEHDSPVRRGVRIEDYLYVVSDDAISVHEILDPDSELVRVTCHVDGLEPVDFLELSGRYLDAGDLWYRFETTHEGLLTLEATLSAEPGGLTLTLCDEHFNELATSALAGGTLRIDWPTDASTTYYLKASAASGVTATGVSFDLRLTNLVRQDGDRLTLYGTDGDDRVEFDAGSPHRITVNGVTYDLDVEASSITFDGADGHDAIDVRGTPGDEKLKASPGHASLSGDGYLFRAVNVEVILVDGGGGNDVAALYDDPAGTDTFHAWPDRAKLYGDGFFIQAKSFPWVHAFSTAGNDDVAVLHDDPAGTDTFKFWPGEAKLYGDGFYTRAKGFRWVHAFSTPGNDDVAVLYDDPGAKDTFKFWPGEAKLYGDGFYNRAKAFRWVHAFSSPGNDDVAVLYDAPDGDDTFKSLPDEAKLYGDGFFNRAKSFRWVYAYATGGNDVAHLYGSEAKDTLVATPEYTKLYGSAFFSRAISFDEVYADAGEGRDTAVVYDATSLRLRTSQVGFEPILQPIFDSGALADALLESGLTETLTPGDFEQFLEGYNFEDLYLRNFPAGHEDSEIEMHDWVLLAFWQ